MTKIQEKLKENKTSVYGLAKHLKTSPPRLSYFIKKNSFEEYRLLKEIAMYLKCDIDDLV